MNQFLDTQYSTELAEVLVHEMAAYEALWLEQGTSFKSLADKFKHYPNRAPTDFVSSTRIAELVKSLSDTVRRFEVSRFGVRVHNRKGYPLKLRDAKNPVELLYYQGCWELINTPAIAVIGARKVSETGIRRTRRLVKNLVDDGFTVVSGLAEGVDAAAHNAAIELGGNTIAVIGTPLSHYYPNKNSTLQRTIATEYLLISQVPFQRYLEQDFHLNRWFFPERNKTMSALTLATVIVEASDRSGTLHQADAAISQGRTLFILESCFKNPGLVWPKKYEAKGAIRVKTYDDIKRYCFDMT
ncbi:Rossmann fold nucleotide-binding protein Smf possibly involved in DNA uptake [hydrothermal vent metagenome]|uniref:Rossmann fold nucleotide-binding protein Smf possibly involved in DNA uptake n=1 Tax=hydrothermal vent metagenome TaxID=652676 RepID=A0A3B0YPL1_9ZZZZ